MGEFTNTMLRNQFVLGLADDAVIKETLAEQKLTFSRAIEIASLVEQVNLEAHIIKQVGPVEQEMYKMERSRQVEIQHSRKSTGRQVGVSILCTRCNRPHDRDKCRAVNAICCT